MQTFKNGSGKWRDLVVKDDRKAEKDKTVVVID